MRRIYTLFFFVNVVFSALTLPSCNEESLVGVDLLPPGELAEIRYLETGGVLGSMVQLDTMNVYASRNVGLVGHLSDPYFGRTDASVIVQFVPYSLAVDFGTDPMADSVILSFKKTRIFSDTARKETRIYGDKTQNMVFTLYRLNTTEFVDTIRYPVTMTAEGKYNTEFIAQTTVTPKDTLVTFNLGKAIGSTLIALDNDTLSYSSRVKFLERFKGFYLKAEPVSGMGAIHELDLQDIETRMVLHYHNNLDTLTFTCFVTDDYGSGPAIRFNVLEHHYEDAPFYGMLDDTTYAGTKLYLQGMAGMGIRLRFPWMDQWRNREDSVIAFHKVELEIPSDTLTYDSLLWRPRYLTMFKKEDGVYSYINDHAAGSSSAAWDPYFGKYELKPKYYRFLATNHFQSYTLGSSSNADLYLYNNAPRLTTEIMERAMISNDPAGRYIKLKVTYSVYPKRK